MAVETSRSVPKAAGTQRARGRGHRSGHSNRRTPGRLRRALATHWYAWSMVAPVVIVIGVIIGYPLARGAWLSLTDANEANVERTIGVVWPYPDVRRQSQRDSCLRKQGFVFVTGLTFRMGLGATHCPFFIGEESHV